MPSLTLPDRLIWFAHVPKAGGTSIEQMMVETWGDRVRHLHWGWDLWWRGGGWREADPPCSPQHLIWADARAALAGAPDEVFGVIRDPVARIASEYRYQMRHRRGTWIGKALAYLPFFFWVRLMLAVARRNPFAFDNHLREQGEFLPDGAVVFRLEDGLEPVAAWLSKATGESVGDPPRALTSEAPDQVRGVVDQATRTRIEAFYAGDYARFDYARNGVGPPARDVWDRMAEGVAPIVVWLERRGKV